MLNEKTQLTYNQGDILAVTIAPDDKIQQYHKANRVQEFLDYFASKFQQLESKNFNHWFRIELSEPIGEKISTMPRLHLHGIIHLKTKLSVYKWLLNVMPDLLQHSLLSIKHIKSQPQLHDWEDYCAAQILYLPQHFYFTNLGTPKSSNITFSEPSAERSGLPSPSSEAT